ncbi:Nn.00g076910.m01.CDS01 [Neocucurbitaria sp. VM-36]
MPLLSRLSRLALSRASPSRNGAFSTTPLSFSAKSLPPRTPLLDADLIENFLKGSGPGGQKINKTSSAVQLKHIPTGIVVKYQDTRSREINRKMARRILQDRIEEMELGEEARTRVKAREKSKKKASSAKKSRRKYRALAEEGKVGGGELEGECKVDGGEGGEEAGEIVVAEDRHDVNTKPVSAEVAGKAGTG